MANPKATTLMEISRLAGCSKAAASSVLNGSRGNIGVSKELRKKVMSVAQRLNYRPNFASRSLALRRTQTLGVYVPPHPWGGIGNPQYAGAMLRGIESACLQRHYNLLIINVAGIAAPERCVESLIEQRVDGLLILWADGDEPWIDDLLQRGSTLAAVDCLRPDSRLDAVMFDNAAAIRMALDHLIGLGHRRIGYLGTCTTQTIPHNEARRQAYMEAMAGHGLAVDPHWVFDASRIDHVVERGGLHCDEAGLLGAAYFAAMGQDRPTALVAFNDMVAASALRQFADAGRSVPGDMSLINVEDTPLCRYLHPRLTSVRHPLEEMGALAAHRLIERATGQSAGPQALRSYCPPELRVRESTAAPAC
ncbi:MAG: LacI family DNA-binding transcriptional regulator [Phycisphaeraceae bacterium]